MSLPDPSSFVLQPEYDFVIVGSGGASMCAALVAKEAGISVAILEKQDVIGGSTGFSGGVWWLPNNPLMKRAGVQDSPELALQYLESVITIPGKGTSPERREAFVATSPRMVEFLEREGMKFVYADGWADYYDDLPGGNSRGRSLQAEPFDINALGPWKSKASLNVSGPMLPFNSAKLIEMMNFTRTWKARGILARLIAATIKNKLLGRNVVSSGGAIQARMIELTVKRHIPIFTGFATDKFVEQDGRVSGVEGTYKGQRVTVRARRGVLLNTGGFARSKELRAKYHRQPSTPDMTQANFGDTGEMLMEAMKLGAATENLDMAIWIPSSYNPDMSAPAGSVDAQGRRWPFMHNADVAAPHFMMVDKSGKRYVDECASYMSVGEAMYQRNALPSFGIFDHRHLKRYFWGPIPPGQKPIKQWLKDGFLTEANSIEELARKVGIDPAGLVAEVEKFNGFARKGVDEDFHKGRNQYDRWRGDPTCKPNPCLGEISEPPFYAVHMWPCDVGTYGGVVSDEYARVLREDGSIIPGLYAAGNCTSSVTGRFYPGAGGSIAASFVFGYIAANHIAGRNMS